MKKFESTVLRSGVPAAALAAALVTLGGCASFDFGGTESDQPARASAGGAVGGTQIVGTTLVPLPPDAWSPVLNNHTPQRVRLFVTLLGQGPVESRVAPAAGGSCPAGVLASLAQRGQTSLSLLDPGCALQAHAPPRPPSDALAKLPTLLRVQVEAVALER